MSKKWTDEDVKKVGEYLAQGLSPEKIGVRLGCSRHAILGIITRTPSLHEFYAPRKREKWDEEVARSMHVAGWPYEQIGRRFGISGQKVHELLDPEYAEMRRMRLQSPLKRSVRKQCNHRNYVKSLENDAEAFRQFASFPRDTRTITGQVLGDPLPGRSALDRMRSGANV